MERIISQLQSGVKVEGKVNSLKRFLNVKGVVSFYTPTRYWGSASNALLSASLPPCAVRELAEFEVERRRLNTFSF